MSGALFSCSTMKLESEIFVCPGIKNLPPNQASEKIHSDWLLQCDTLYITFPGTYGLPLAVVRSSTIEAPNHGRCDCFY